MQEMKPSMFSPIIPDSSAPFNTGKYSDKHGYDDQNMLTICDLKFFLVSGSPGVSSTDYYSTNPYTQYSNSYGVAYNYPAPSPASAGPGGLLSK